MKNNCLTVVYLVAGVVLFNALRVLAGVTRQKSETENKLGRSPAWRIADRRSKAQNGR